MKDGFPEHFEILPHSIERVIEGAKKIGQFLLGTQEVPAHMSDHYVREHFHPEDDPQGKLFEA